MRILEVVARYGAGTTARDITEALSLPTATAYRLLNVLVGDEYLVRTSDLRGFALGRALTGLITASFVPTISTAARKLLQEFRLRTRFAVHLVSFTGSSIKVTNSDPDHPIRSEGAIMRYTHASAAGKLFLSQVGQLSDAIPLGHLKKLTPYTITDPLTLQQDLNQISMSGFSVQVDELEDGRCCLAVPIGGLNLPALGALCLAGTSERVDAIKEHLPSAQQTAAKLHPLLF